MLKTVTVDLSEFLETNPVPVAPAGSKLPVWTNSHGAVAVILQGNIQLGVRPGEFEIIEWLE